MEFYFRFRFWAFCCYLHGIVHRRTKFYPNWRISDGVITLCKFSKMAAIWRSYRRKSTSAFWFYDVSHIGRQRSIWVPNFDQIFQSTTEILLRPLPKSKRSPYWNSTSGFHIEPFTAVGMWFCINLPNFVQIRWSPTELWTHIDFTRWRP